MTQYVIAGLDYRVRGFVDADEPPVVDGALVAEMDPPVPCWPRPDPYYAEAELLFIGGALQWHDPRPLAAAKAAAWEAAKSARDAAEAADFEFEGVMYQPDIKRITGGVLNALMAQLAGVPFSEEWTVSDNTSVWLDGAQMQALGLALARRISDIHATGRAMRKAIADATDPAEAYTAAIWPPTIEEPNV